MIFKKGKVDGEGKRPKCMAIITDDPDQFKSGVILQAIKYERDSKWVNETNLDFNNSTKNPTLKIFELRNTAFLRVNVTDPTKTLNFQVI